MPDFFVFFLYSLAGYVFLKMLLAFFEVRATVKQVIKEAESRAEIAIPVKFEYINDVYFVWNSHNDEFLAQGKDYDELVAAIQIRFKKGVNMVVDPSDTVYQQLKLTKQG